MFKVSKDGRVFKDGVEVNQVMNNGYKCVNYTVGGKKKKLRVHRAVATHFVPNPEGKPYVNHIDGDKTNNDWRNPEWVTALENSEHAVRTGLHKPKGESNGNSRLGQEDVARTFELRKQGLTYKEIALEVGASFSWVDKVLNGRLRT